MELCHVEVRYRTKPDSAPTNQFPNGFILHWNCWFYFFPRVSYFFLRDDLPLRWICLFLISIKRKFVASAAWSVTGFCWFEIFLTSFLTTFLMWSLLTEGAGGGGGGGGGGAPAVIFAWSKKSLMDSKPMCNNNLMNLWFYDLKIPKFQLSLSWMFLKYKM